MGVIIFADDDAKYRTGDYLVMYGEMTVSPTVDNMTFIYHTDKFTEKDAIMWASIIPYRMVIVGKLPKLTKASEHCVIVDQQVKVKQDYSRSIRAALCWADRDRARRALTTVPIPLANAFVRVNVHDIELGRLLARCKFTLHDDYTKAAIAYGISPVRNFKWPPKSNRALDILPLGMRQTDKHLDIIVNNDLVVSNEIRTHQADALPVGLPKKQQEVITWL
tara:strand:- start:208 stop:870 length:663 start_codon:yes stop_codon:yes gene_type:complete